MTASVSASRGRFVGVQLFALSFAALFLELMLIRWVPAVVKSVAYYANLMLISSFLGLGIGAMLARRGRRLFPLFPLLLVANVGFLLACTHFGVLAATESEARLSDVPLPAQIDHLMLIGVFLFNAALFVPIGQHIGELFHELPPLRAYAFDLAGSLAGTLCFGLFSLYRFSPVIGLLAVMVIYLLLANWRAQILALLLCPLAVLGVLRATDRQAIWSPYHYVTISPLLSHRQLVSEPPPNLRTMHDPPVYWVHVGRDFYQHHGTLDASRYTPGTEHANWISSQVIQYMLPYHIAQKHNKIAVMGAGGGMDVEAALLAGATHVDATEIDPTLVAISRRVNASGVYDDPRVRVLVNDARAEIRNMPGGYDMIVFGLIDSHALFSYMSNLRLDGYIYTVESIRTAYSKLADDGMLSLTFFCPTEWMAPKLVQMVKAATSREPIVYGHDGWTVICVPRGNHQTPAPSYGSFVPLNVATAAPIDLPTDDWPYLYLSKKTIPQDYLIVIGSMMLLSAIVLTLVLYWTVRDPPGPDQRKSWISASEAHFFFMGFAFLLLQTKNVTDCSLYFGTTWLVTTIVIAGVLLMVLAANLVAMRLRATSRWFYLPLFASLLLLYFVPRDQILSWSIGARLAWALLVVPLPIFFAGLIFSTTFRVAASPSLAFGANLIGATLGGFSEYLGMAIGTQALGWIVIGAYLASLGVRATMRHARVTAPEPIAA